MKVYIAYFFGIICVTMPNYAFADDQSRYTDFALVAVSAVHCGMLIDDSPHNIYPALGIDNYDEVNIAFSGVGRSISGAMKRWAEFSHSDDREIAKIVLCKGAAIAAKRIGLKFSKL